jgi:hypothetical protein
MDIVMASKGLSWLAAVAAALAACEGASPGPPDGEADVEDEDAGDAAEEAEEPFVRILSPEEGSEVPDPVTFVFEAGGGVVTVEFEADGWPLQAHPIGADAGTHTYDFSGTGFERHVVLTGFDASAAAVATDEVRFTPVEEACRIPDQPGFNHYTVRAINDWVLYPKDGTYPYCWEYYGDVCGEMWGQIHDGTYGGELLFPGGGDCFCSGHTLEIFLRAYALYLEEMGLPDTTLFEHMGSRLEVGSVDVGAFYQHWQGFGVATDASAADAFESEGIGMNMWEEDWDSVLPGDYVNLSRSTGSGHAVIFVGWVWEDGVRVGLRYYGCNGSGQSCPDPEDPLVTTGNSGPSFVTEHFEGHGGTVLPGYLFIGRVFMPVSS